MTIMFKLDILDSIFYCMIKALIAYERALPTQNQDFVFYLIFFANKTMNYESVLYVKEVGGPKIQFLLEEIFLLAIICIHTCIYIYIYIYKMAIFLFSKSIFFTNVSYKYGLIKSYHTSFYHMCRPLICYDIIFACVCSVRYLYSFKVQSERQCIPTIYVGSDCIKTHVA